MRAAFFDGCRDISVREAPDPEPEPGRVRLRVRYCGICGSDLSLYKTGLLSGPGAVMGHEFSAVVEDDPEGVWSSGTRVAFYPAGRGCGKCLWCREGKPRYCLEPRGPHDGGLAELVSQPPETLLRIPEALDDRTAALAEPLGVALRATEEAAPSPGDVAFVLGLGSIGLLSVSALAAAGCRVVGADVRAERRELGIELGCDDVFDPVADDPFWKLLTHDLHGPRVAFECSGAPESVQRVINACGHEGVIGLLGIPFEPTVVIPAVLAVKEQRLFSISGPSRASMERALRHLVERPDVAKIISETVPLEATPDAFARLADGTGGVKVLVEPGA